MTVAAGEQLRGITLTNGTTLWLSERDLGEAGYREVTVNGKRVGQFGLCRDAHGAWVYPEFRAEGESAHDTVERCGRDKGRMTLCAKGRRTRDE